MALETEFREEHVNEKCLHANHCAKAVVRYGMKWEIPCNQVITIVVGSHCKAEVDILTKVEKGMRPRKPINPLASDGKATRKAAETVNIEGHLGSTVLRTAAVVLR
jgi:hypothetical protein